jgi:hypothetical protein
MLIFIVRTLVIVQDSACLVNISKVHEVVVPDLNFKISLIYKKSRISVKLLEEN